MKIKLINTQIKMTQHRLIIEYIKHNGSITPATLNDKDRAFEGHWLGSETARRCRELEDHDTSDVQKYPRLVSERVGKYVQYWLPETKPSNSEIVREFLAKFPSKVEPIKTGQLKILI